MKQKKRFEIDVKDTWDLTPIYKSKEEFLNDYENFKVIMKDILKYKNHILDSSKSLLEFLELSDKLERNLYRLYYYAHLSFDVDTTNNESKELILLVDNIMIEYEEYNSFVVPELLKEDYMKVLEFISNEPGLKQYEYNLKNIYRYKSHTLSEEGEYILSSLGVSLSSPSTIFESLTDSDLTFPSIVVDGKKQEFTESNYFIFVESNNLKVRKKAFENLFKTYAKYNHTIADTFRLNIEANSKISKLKHYKSSIEASLYGDNIDTSVYDNLINTVSDNLDVLYKYYDLKKEVLELDKLHLYDIYMPLVNEVDKDYTFIEAKKIVMDALKVFGKEYLKKLNKAFDNRFIDIYNNKGKRGGAYSSGFYDTYPYILLNFEGKYNDVTTLAHELGHSMHTMYSCENNTYNNSNYKIIVAEVASTVNELILIRYLIKKTNDNKEKLYLLNKLLELFKGTIFRQTMFAEFERDMYESHEKGNVLTSDYLNDSYYKLVKKYFGPNVYCDKLIKYEWERIPHFYYGFYAYKYAIGLSAACKIVHDIENSSEAISKYLDFLKTGGSMDPADELLIAGVDIKNPEFISDAIKMFDETIEEFKKVYNEKL